MRRILKMPVWLFILICVFLFIVLSVGITIAIIAIVFHRPVDPSIVQTDVKVESVEFNNHDAVILEIGDTYNLEYTIIPSNAVNKKVSFKSSDDAVATVTDAGLVTAIAYGNVTIEVITQDGNLTDSIVIIVKMKQVVKDLTEEIQASIDSMSSTSFDVSDTIECNLDSPFEISFGVLVEDATYSWTSSNSNILKVASFTDGKLEVDVLSTGTVTLTLVISSSYSEDITKEFTITILDNSTVSNIDITSVEILGLLSEYYEGDVIDLNQINLLVRYSDNTTKLNRLSSSFPNLELSTDLSECEICEICGKPKKTYEITYKEMIGDSEKTFTFSFSYFVIPVEVIKLKLNGLNDKYFINDVINITRITVYYNNDTIKYIDLDDIVTNIDDIDMSSIGEKEIIVTYQNKEYKFNITVTENEKKVIDIKPVGLHEYYYLGEAIIIEYVTITYSDDSKENLTINDVSNNLADIDTNSLGIKHIVMSLGEITFEKDVEVLSSLYQIRGLKSSYESDEDIDFTSVKLVKYEESVEEVKITDAFSLVELNELFKHDTEGVKVFEVVYQGNTYKSGDITIIKVNSIISLDVMGLKDYYFTGDEITGLVVLAKKKDGTVSTVNLSETTNNMALINNNQKGTYELVISYEGVEFKKNITFYKGIDAFNVIGIKNEYYISEEIDLNNVGFRFTFGPNDYEEKGYNDQDITIVGALDTTSVGEKELKVSYENQEFIFKYLVKYYKYNGYNLVSFKSYYALGEVIDGVIELICNDGSKTITTGLNDAIVTGNDTTSLGAKQLIITIANTYFENDVVITHNYEIINPLSLKNDSKVSLLSVFDFYVNIDSRYQLTSNLLVKTKSSYNVLSVSSDGGKYLVSVELISNSSAVVECYLEGTNALIAYNIKKIAVNDRLFTCTLNVPKNYLPLNTKANLEVIVAYDGMQLDANELDVLSFTFSGADGITKNKNKASFTSSVPLEYTITAVVSDGTYSKTVTGKVNYAGEPLTNLGFVMGSKSYGIGKEYVLASKYIRNTLTQKVAKVMTYEFDVFGSSQNIDKSNLYFYVKEDEEYIAKFVNNVLNVYEDGYVTLYVTTKDAINLGYTQDEYLGIYIGLWRVRCVGNALYCNDYNHLKFAFDNGFNAVLDASIMLGPEVMNISYDKETNTTTRTLKEGLKPLNAIAQLSGSLYRIESTWSTKYIENIALLTNKTPSTTIYAALNITGDLYGNGYTLDASQYTTLSECISGSSIPFFQGPKKFVETLSLVRIYGQDDIGFLVRDNVTIDNVVFQNCDSGYLNKNDKLELSMLNDVGTVMEIMGDNTVIKNCRLRNGRNVIRCFGTENPDELMHTTISNSIISNAREFLVKIGANKNRRTDTVMKYEDKLVHVTDFYDVYNMNMSEVSKNIFKGIPGNSELVYSSSSPYLLKEDGSNYNPRDYNNYNDDYFMATYLKTDVTIADCVLENCGFFGICLEAMFSGPILGGYQYAPKDVDLGIAGFNYNGIYDIAATSYSACLHLKGDVRIYNWKNIDEFDSTTIMEQIGNAQPLLKLVGEDTKLEFNIKDILNNVAPTDPTIIDTIDGVTYAHGGIAFYGGGKNYHIIDMSEYTGYTFTTHDVQMSQMGDSVFVKCIPLMAGNEPFRFVMYDSTSELNYTVQQALYDNGEAYSNIK